MLKFICLSCCLELTNESVNEELTHEFKTNSSFRLNDFGYSSDKLMKIIFNNLAKTKFDGITGPVRFDGNGTRDLDDIIVYQYRKRINESDRSTYLDRVIIGSVHRQSSTFLYVDGENNDTVWKGLLPRDGRHKRKVVTVSTAVTAIYLILASLGIVLATVCLIFNFTWRKTKIIKLASFKLNYCIGIGAVILYLDTIFFVIPTKNPDAFNVFCNLTPWFTAIGYSLCYGTILAKMVRIYLIFDNPFSKKELLKDQYLFLGVASLVAIDLIILVVYTLVEGIKNGLIVHEVVHKERPVETVGVHEIIRNNFILACDSIARDVFLGILYGYKMLLQIFALLLAFSIRKVKVKGLNDAKYVAAAVYVTSIVSAVMVVAVYSLKDAINGFAALFGTGLLVGTTAILLLVFAPLMMHLHLDPKGEDVFNSTDIARSFKEPQDSENEVECLRKRVRALEDALKNKEEMMLAASPPTGSTTYMNSSM